MADHLDAMKTRYAATLKKMDEEKVRRDEIRLDGQKLLIKATAPTQEAKNRVWDTIKATAPAWKTDLSCDIRVDASVAPEAAAAEAKAKTKAKTYTVKSGDTLSKIAKEFYGNAGSYMKIFEANKDKLDNPDKIKVGQELVIPE